MQRRMEKLRGRRRGRRNIPKKNKGRNTSLEQKTRRRNKLKKGSHEGEAEEKIRRAEFEAKHSHASILKLNIASSKGRT